MGCLTVLFCLSCFFLVFRVSTAVDNIAANTSIADGETLVSPGGYYELGFFDPGNSKRYIGIWYKKIVNGTIVWVANGDSPLNDSSGILQLSEQGNLVISSDSGFQVWSSNTSKQGAKNLQARLLDTGNFIIKDGEETLWQSFDHIGNTLLPEMKLGRNLVTGLDWYLTSWKNENDPVTGEYTVRLDVNGYPQFFLRKGSMVQGRWGPWNGLTFSGTTHLKPNSIYNYNFVYNEEEIYYHFELESLVITRLLLDPVGVQQGHIWIDRKAEWNVYVTVQLDPCDQYALCGPYGSCNIDNSPRCGCLRGFQPMSPTEWDSGDWSKGCIRKIALTCKNGEGFLHVSSIKLPDTSKSWYDRKMSLNACQEMCTKNCSCIAYANQDIRYGSGCLLWFDELTDIREYTDNGQDLYIRMSASELGGGENVAVVRIKRSSVEKVVVRVVTPVLIGIVILGLICVLRERKIRRLKLEVPELHIQEIYANDDDDGSQKDLELPLFDFDVVADATNEFSNKNKIGEGGFGSVYKGILKDGQEIAVKRLSKDSRQGVSEFKNEVALIAKLQHRNLVKLLGCCIQEEEKILIYEYMPNKSLDSFIFSLSPSIAMDWTLRCHIINGIARGLLYLHQDSRLRIIHRDLKPSNVLLDKEMNPKISDFGIAKGFGGVETEANTLRVVGTYGYMSPEYIIDGAFSVKSDVFSFGVLLLEIISGRSNRRFIHPGHKLNLLGHAWKLFQEGRSNELIDASIAETCNECQVLRYIQVGLLCVQQNPEPRPTMASVMLMLSSDMALPLPKEPGFFAERQLVAEGGSSSSVIELISMNQMTITAPEAR